jgi:hypothetical protein
MKDERGLFFSLTGAFIIALIGLVLSHELGHYFASLSYGYRPKISYAYTDFGFPKTVSASGVVSFDVPIEHQIWILAVGPIVTIGIGTIGFILLFIFRRPFRRHEILTIGEWALVIVSFSWLRPLVNFSRWMLTIEIFNNLSLKSDEMKIAYLLGWPQWSIFIFSAVAAAIIFLIVIFKFIPLKQRQTLLLAMLVGGAIGHLLWIDCLGPIILP